MCCGSPGDDLQVGVGQSQAGGRQGSDYRGFPHRQSDALFYAMGDFIEGLGGRYITAEDSGTSVADILKISQRTSFVSGVNTASDFGGDPSPSTAYGVFVSLREAVSHKLGRSDLKGLKVAVQGLGNVGYRLAEFLSNAGAELFVSDIVQANVDRAVSNLNATAVPGSSIYGPRCGCLCALCAGCVYQ